MNDQQKEQFKKIERKVLLRGGECLSDTYINNLTKMDFKCDKGHLWNASYNQIVNHGQWCPECNLDKEII